MPESYALVQSQDVMNFLKHAGAVKRRALDKAIWGLQDDPRPDGHVAADELFKGFTKIVVRELVPPYALVYLIDEEQKKVVVLAVSREWG